MTPIHLPLHQLDQHAVGAEEDHDAQAAGPTRQVRQQTRTGGQVRERDHQLASNARRRERHKVQTDELHRHREGEGQDERITEGQDDDRHARRETE
eukprot:5319401-Pyramimonas_sp.AAC.1